MTLGCQARDVSTEQWGLLAGLLVELAQKTIMGYSKLTWPDTALQDWGQVGGEWDRSALPRQLPHACLVQVSLATLLSSVMWSVCWQWAHPLPCPPTVSALRALTTALNEPMTIFS